MKCLFDIDGVLLDDFRPLPGSAETIAWIRERSLPYLYLTNTTLHPRKVIAERLRPIDHDVTAESILSPARVAATMLRETGAECRLLVPPGLREEFSGIREGDPPEAIVMADLRDGFTYALMNEVFRCVMEGADILALHKNRYWKTEGEYVIDLGPWVALLEYASHTSATIVGKPSAAYFRAALDLIGSDPSDAVMIGDDIENDIGGAQKAGLRGILVRTGKYHPAMAAKSGVKPDAVIDSITDLPTLLASW